MQTKGSASRKNMAHPMNIDITSSSDNSDFVNFLKKGALNTKVRTTLGSRQPAMHTDGEAAVKKYKRYSSTH
jgi:hypothetical protein